MDLKLNGKVAVVTGASRGIGRSIAEALAAEGSRVLVCARTEDTLVEAAGAMRERGAEVKEIVLDISDPDAGERLVRAAHKAYGPIDIFVGSAGTNRRKPFIETTEEDWSAVLDLNLRAHVRCSRAVVKDMKPSEKGSIVFVSSIFGREAGGPGLSIYNTTKSALISLAKIMAMELAPHGIRVNTVAPGSIRFPGGSWDRRCKEDPEHMELFIRENLPMGRFGTATEVADVVTFLSSARASWISGACITVDGCQSKSLI